MTIDEMMQDLAEADASGDTELAAVIADRIRQAESAQKSSPMPLQRKGDSLVSDLMRGNVAGLAERFPSLTGFGRGISEMGTNLANNIGADPVVGPYVERLRAPELSDNQDEAWNQFKERHPYTAQGGRIGAHVAPGAAVAPASLLGGLGVAATTALLEEDPISAALWGGGATAGGRAIGGLFGRLRNTSRGNYAVEPISDAVEGSSKYGRLRGKGYIVEPGKATGKHTTAFDAMRKHPFTRFLGEKIDDYNQELFQKSAADALGVDNIRFDDDGMEAVLKVLKDRYDDVVRDLGNLTIPKDFVDDAVDLLPKRTANRILDSYKNGKLSGTAFKTLRSKISELTARHGDKQADAIALVRDLDDLVADQVDPAAKAAYDTVREQFRNYFAISGIRGGGRSAEGLLKPATMQTRLRTVYGDKPPRLDATRNMRQDASDLALLTRPYQHSPGTFESAINTSGFIPSLLTSGRPLQGAYLLGAPNASAQALGSLLGRTLANPAVRESTPYYPGLLVEPQQ